MKPHSILRVNQYPVLLHDGKTLNCPISLVNDTIFVQVNQSLYSLEITGFECESEMQNIIKLIAPNGKHELFKDLIIKKGIKFVYDLGDYVNAYASIRIKSIDTIADLDFKILRDNKSDSHN